MNQHRSMFDAINRLSNVREGCAGKSISVDGGSVATMRTDFRATATSNPKRCLAFKNIRGEARRMDRREEPSCSECFCYYSFS